jgi:hypothetical protein
MLDAKFPHAATISENAPHDYLLFLANDLLQDGCPSGSEEHDPVARAQTAGHDSDRTLAQHPRLGRDTRSLLARDATRVWPSDRCERLTRP